MPYNQYKRNFIKTIPRLTPSVWKEDKIHRAKWPNQANCCAECYSKYKAKQIQNDKFWIVFFSSVVVGAPPFILGWWGMDSKLEASYLDHNLNQEEVCVCYTFGADLAQLCSDPVGQFSGNRQSKPSLATVFFTNFRLIVFSNICVILSIPGCTTSI